MRNDTTFDRNVVFNASCDSWFAQNTIRNINPLNNGWYTSITDYGIHYPLSVFQEMTWIYHP
jgi:hypothetical protein